jgi:ADP-heptose:LPS heptosyltransferase
MTNAFSPGLLGRLGEVREVVLVRASRVGDFVCATPAFRALRSALPGARITLVGLPLVRDLYARSTNLDRFIPFLGFPGIAEQFFRPRLAVRFFDYVQSERFDLAIQMHGTGVYSNTFTLMLGARATSGFVREGDGPGRLDAAFAMPSSGHEVKRLLAFMEFLGANAGSDLPEYPLWSRDHAHAERLLVNAKPPFIGLHMYARKTEKCWPAERFAQAGTALRSRHGGTIVLLGDCGDSRPEGRPIPSLEGTPCLDLVGQTSLGSLGAIIQRLSLLLTNDSGPAHIAYALGVPTVVIFGETDPERWGPPLPGGPFRVVKRNLPCYPCQEDSCSSGYACLRSVSVEQVVEAGTEVLRK